MTRGQRRATGLEQPAISDAKADTLAHYHKVPPVDRSATSRPWRAERVAPLIEDAFRRAAAQVGGSRAKKHGSGLARRQGHRHVQGSCRLQRLDGRTGHCRGVRVGLEGAESCTRPRPRSRSAAASARLKLKLGNEGARQRRENGPHRAADEYPPRTLPQRAALAASTTAGPRHSRSWRGARGRGHCPILHLAAWSRRAVRSAGPRVVSPGPARTRIVQGRRNRLLAGQRDEVLSGTRCCNDLSRVQRDDCEPAIGPRRCPITRTEVSGQVGWSRIPRTGGYLRPTNRLSLANRLGLPPAAG